MKNILIKVLSICLICVGLFFLGKPFVTDYFTGKKAEYSQNSYKKNLKKDDVDKLKQKIDDVKDDSKALKDLGVDYDYSNINAVNLNSVNSLSEDVIQSLPRTGGIAVPDLGINIPIYEGVTEYNLLAGAGTMKLGQQMGQGNYALASHYVNGGNGIYLFTPLLKAQAGMKVYLTDAGDVYEYEIYRAEHVGAENVQLVEDEEALNAGSPITTLLTCYQTAEQGRFVVQAKLTKIYKNDSAPQKIKNYFGLATWKLQ